MSTVYHHPVQEANFLHKKVALKKRPPLYRSRTPPKETKRPTKTVRFPNNASLESIRLFRKTEMPKACRQDPVCPKTYRFQLKPDWNPAPYLPVRLKEIWLEDTHLIGTVEVANLAFEKHLEIRYTRDDWYTTQSTDGTFLEMADTWDRFRFKIELDHVCYPQSIQFAIKYSVANKVFWDNNQGVNYSLDLVSDLELLDESCSSGSDTDDEERLPSFRHKIGSPPSLTSIKTRYRYSFIKFTFIDFYIIISFAFTLFHIHHFVIKQNKQKIFILSSVYKVKSL